MASTFSPNLRIELIGTGEQQGTWGATTNINLGTLVEQAICGYVSVTVDDVGDTTLTVVNGESDQSRNMVINLTGALTASRNVICPAIEKIYAVKNSTSGGHDVTFKVSGQTGVVIPNGEVIFLYVDGTDANNITGSLATQYADDVSIVGGVIDGVDIINGTMDNTTISNVSIDDSTITNGDIVGSNVSNVTIVTSTIDNSNVTDGTIVGSSLSNVSIDISAITNGTMDGTSLSNVSITNGTMTGTTINSASINSASINSPTITGGTINNTTFSNVTISNTSNVSISGGNLSNVTISTSIFNGGTINSSSIVGGTINGASIIGGSFSDSSGNNISISNVSITSGAITGVTNVESTNFNVGNASDTTITRVSAGVIAVEGNQVPSPGSVAQGDVLYYNGTNWATLAAGSSGQYLFTSGASANPSWQYLKPIVSSTTNVASPWAWNSTGYDEFAITALANNLTINADAGSPYDGQKVVFRFKPSGANRTLTWTTGTAKSFRAIGVTIPTLILSGKTVYVGCIYNSADSRWDVVAATSEA